MTLTPGTVLVLPLPAGPLVWTVVGRKGADLELRSPFAVQVERLNYTQVQQWIAGGQVSVRQVNTWYQVKGGRV